MTPGPVHQTFRLSHTDQMMPASTSASQSDGGETWIIPDPLQVNSTSNFFTPPVKGDDIQSPGPDYSRVGGEDCSSASAIGAIPFSDTGNTCTYADDYNCCPPASVLGLRSIAA